MKNLALALCLFLVSLTQASAQTPYYQGKTMRIAVGNLAGDAYDLWARLFAQYMPKFLDEGLGINFNIVSGYPGGGEIDLGIERGEWHCRTLTISTYFAREPFLTWHKKGFVKPILQTPLKRDPRVADVPTIHEFMDKYKTSDNIRRVAKVLLAPAIFGRPMVATPGVPPERVKILRDAYHRSLKDPGMLADLKKRKWIVDSISGEELEKLAKEVIDQPPDVIARMKKLLGG